MTLPLALLLTGHLSEMTDLWRRAAENHQPLKIVVGLVAALIYLVIWTWKRLVDSLFLGLTGRKWIIQGSIVTSIFGFVALVAIGSMIYKTPEVRAVVLPLIPWILALWVLCRVWLAAWAVRRLLDQNLISRQTLMHWLLAIVILGATLFGTFAWVVPRMGALALSGFRGRAGFADDAPGGDAAAVGVESTSLTRRAELRKQPG